MSAIVKLMARCTTCKKTAEVSSKQLAEAREIGCVFSTCCSAVATVEQASVTRTMCKPSRNAKRKAADDKYLQPGWQLPRVRS